MSVLIVMLIMVKAIKLLNYRDEKRKEQYSFNELKVLSNKAANVLVDKANVQRGSMYLSLCQERLNYILPFWVF